MARGGDKRQKNTRRTITAAGEHNPAKKQVGQLPFVGTIRVRCRIASFCAILGVRALSPFLSLSGSPSRFKNIRPCPQGMQAKPGRVTPFAPAAGKCTQKVKTKFLRDFTKRVKIFTSLWECTHAGRVSPVIRLITVHQFCIGCEFYETM